MIHDPDLLDRLSAFLAETFSGDAFRATRKSLDPLTPSTTGGRWALRNQCQILYTSLEREGALAEIWFHWGQLTPLPSKPVILHRLKVDARNNLRLVRVDLQKLGVDVGNYVKYELWT